MQLLSCTASRLPPHLTPLQGFTWEMRGIINTLRLVGDALLLDASSPMGGEELPGSWDGVCDWVIGRWVDVWDTIFEAAFLQRSRNIISYSFNRVQPHPHATLYSFMTL